MHAASKILGPDPYFRVRGEGVTRVEAICDTIFGFAVTLLIVSGTESTSYTELIRVLRGFPAFAFCFLILARIWYSHYQFHRRFGLEDKPTIVLNLALMFVVLFFVFPLKMLIGNGTNAMIWALTRNHGAQASPLGELEPGQLAFMLEVFAGGFAFVNLITGLLYAHAYRLRKELALSTLEDSLTRCLVYENLWVGIMFTFTAIALEALSFHGMIVALGLQVFAAIGRRLLRKRFWKTVSSDTVSTAE